MTSSTVFGTRKSNVIHRKIASSGTIPGYSWTIYLDFMRLRISTCDDDDGEEEEEEEDDDDDDDDDEDDEATCK